MEAAIGKRSCSARTKEAARADKDKAAFRSALALMQTTIGAHSMRVPLDSIGTVYGTSLELAAK